MFSFSVGMAHYRGTISEADKDPNRFSVTNLIQLIHSQDPKKTELIESNQKKLNELKKEISLSSKKNFNLEREIRTLDQKIALLIRNRITIDEVIATSLEGEGINRTITLKDKREREQYGQLFWVLQNATHYISHLARLVRLGEIDNLLQTVMFTLYGNQYDEHEEHLLLSMFKTVLAEEFKQAKGLGSLLRANTALTRMMTTYTRRGPGQQYLKLTLSSVLNGITNQPDLSLEINPLKVYEALIIEQESKLGQAWEGPRKPTPEEAAADRRVQHVIAPRIKKLGELADTFLDAIIASLPTVPYGIRWICRQIRELTKSRFPTATREQCCSMIGGFFLLRFVNPAIVTPQAFMLCDTKLSANTRRNLTLLAKILQNLANNIQFGGVKEFFMSPLNTVLDKNRERVNRCLEELCRVDDLEEHLSIDKYIALGRTEDHNINISLNEIFFIHGLLVEHAETLEPNTDDILRKLLRELGPAPPQLPRKDNANVELKLENRYKDILEDYTPEQRLGETRYLIFSALKDLPQNIASHPAFAKDKNDLRILVDIGLKFANEKKNKKLVEILEQIRTNLKLLTDVGLVRLEDGCANLRRDVGQEILNFETQIAKSEQDLARLQNVLQNIHEHNKFLGGQYDAYKEYLENVRQTCTTSTKKKGKDKEEQAEKKQQKKGPFKYSHSQLEKDLIIIESEVPEERRAHISFSFSCTTPGIYDVAVLYRSRAISDMKFHLDDLLERQHNNELEFETDFLKLNVNLLIYLLNKHFISDK